MNTVSVTSGRRGAFTLVEMVIAMSVLTLLSVFVGQLVSSATIVTTNSRKHVDADSQARLVFDRVAGDISRMIQRTDVDYLFSKQAGNDKLFFYSEAPAYYDGSASSFKTRSSVALVGYRINADHQFERLGKLLNWSGDASTQPGSLVFLTYPPSTTAVPKPAPLPATLLENNWATTLGSGPTYDGSDIDYHVMADCVCRLEFCFQLKSGQYALDPAGGGAASVHSLKDVSAIVVALVVLDAASQKIVDIGKVSAAFADPTDADLNSNPPVLMAETWRRQLSDGTFATTNGISQTAAGQIRIYERHFALHVQ